MSALVSDTPSPGTRWRDLNLRCPEGYNAPATEARTCRERVCRRLIAANVGVDESLYIAPCQRRSSMTRSFPDGRASSRDHVHGQVLSRSPSSPFGAVTADVFRSGFEPSVLLDFHQRVACPKGFVQSIDARIRIGFNMLRIFSNVDSQSSVCLNAVTSTPSTR